MARAKVIRFSLLTLSLFFATAACAQKVETAGKAWLAEQTAPPEINVNGAWNAKSWGRIVLNQSAGSRDITGTASDGWDILGVVSGKDVFLLFSSRGTVNYSAKLSQEDPNTLAGQYANGMISARHKGPRGRLRDIRLIKAN